MSVQEPGQSALFQILLNKLTDFSEHCDEPF